MRIRQCTSCVGVSMSVLRKQPKGARLASFGAALVMFAVYPRDIGYQDIAALLARQPGVTERWQKHAFGGSLSTIRAATFSFARPLGTREQHTASYRLASLDSRGIDITGSLARNPLGQVIRPPQPYEFPTVDRSGKGDRLVVRTLEPVTAPQESVLPSDPDAAADSPSDIVLDNQVEAAPAVSVPQTVPAQTGQPPAATSRPANVADAAPLDAELAEAMKQQPLATYDSGVAPDAPNAGAAEAKWSEPAAEDGLTVQTARLFFGQGSLGVAGDRLESWQQGEEPIIIMPRAADPDMKATVSLPTTALPDEGTSVVGKGEVTGPDQRPKSPAERMGLTDKTRAKQEKCLAEAVYFEARGEAVRGQIAVAQVVVNRAFSGYYPATVCGVVYQNAHRHLACQFTFACDNVKDVVREPDMWERAKKIAKETLDGRIWLPEVGKSTHYHAYWVRPSWVHEMKKNYKFGVHTFYRPRNWGDGSDAPSWGTPQQTAAISAELAAKKD